MIIARAEPVCSRIGAGRSSQTVTARPTGRQRDGARSDAAGVAPRASRGRGRGRRAGTGQSVHSESSRPGPGLPGQSTDFGLPGCLMFSTALAYGVPTGHPSAGAGAGAGAAAASAHVSGGGDGGRGPPMSAAAATSGSRTASITQCLLSVAGSVIVRVEARGLRRCGRRRRSRWRASMLFVPGDTIPAVVW